LAKGLDSLTQIGIPLNLFLSRWHSQSWIGWRHQFFWSQFSILQQKLKAGSGVACVFVGFDDVDVEAFKLILRKN